MRRLGDQLVEPSLPRLLRRLTRFLWYHRAAAMSACFRWLRWFPFGCDTVKNVAFLGRFCRVEPVRHTVLATDETVTVVTADGDVVVDEVLSVVGEDGELHAVEEELTVIEADEA